MEVLKLLNTIEEFVKLVQNQAAYITDTMKKLEDGANLLKSQLTVHKSVIRFVRSYSHTQILIHTEFNWLKFIVHRANPPTHVLKQFPDIKHRLVNNLCSFIDEEINALIQAAYVFNQLNVQK